MFLQLKGHFQAKSTTSRAIRYFAITTVNQIRFYFSSSEEGHLFNQSEHNDLVRELELSKSKAYF